jgi:hypothetical protein
MLVMLYIFCPSFSAVILTKDCPQTCQPREECPFVSDDQLRSSICDVSPEGQLFVCCNKPQRPPAVAPTTAEHHQIPDAAIGFGSQTTRNDTKKRGACPLDPRRGECGIVAADRVWNGDVASAGQFPWVVSLFYRFPHGK